MYFNSTSCCLTRDQDGTCFMKKPIVHSPHDKLFRSSLQFPVVAREFLELYLPLNIKKIIDFNSIQYCQTSFIDESLKLSQTDVLFRVQLANQAAYIYILAEHESTVDPLIAFWLKKYMVAIWDYHIKENTSKKEKVLPLPFIVPLVFYTGGEKYSAERSFYNLFGGQSDLMKQLLIAPFHLVHVEELSEQDLRSHIFAGTMSFIMQKHFQRHLNQEIHKIVANLNQLDSCDHRRFLIELIRYMLNIDNEHSDVKELVGILKYELSPVVEKEMTSLAEKLMEQGFEKGIEKGMEKGMEKGIEKGEMQLIKKMLQNGVEPAFIAKNTGVVLQKIKEIQQKLLLAQEYEFH